MTIAANSSPLIALGKQGKLELIRRRFKQLVIPKGVYDEILIKKDSPEAVALQKAVEDGRWVSVKEITINKLIAATKKIGQGEKEAISLAAKHSTQLLIDDDSAKSYASALGVEAYGTLYVLYLSCLRKLISKSEAANLLKSMIDSGFYISTELYSKFFELLNSIK